MKESKYHSAVRRTDGREAMQHFGDSAEDAAFTVRRFTDDFRAAVCRLEAADKAAGGNVVGRAVARESLKLQRAIKRLLG